MTKGKRIGVLTGGGDAPGLNPAIRAVVLRAAEEAIEVTGIYDGWEGLLDDHIGETFALDPSVVRTWDRDGGTHLGSSRTNPFKTARKGAQHRDKGEKHTDRSAEVLENIRSRFDGLIAIGGEDTLGVASKLFALGAPVVGIPKTIDKDLGATDYTLGFDTSLRTCADIIERSRTPAGSHHWIQIVEVMGRHAGHLALWSGLAGGAHAILIPEHPFRLERLCALLEERLALGRRDRRHPRYAVVVVAEGATPVGHDLITVENKADDFGHVRLGGVGAWLAEQIRKETPWDARAVALGHPQRGGPPSATDRLMGFLFGTAAVEAILGERWGMMVSARGIAPACEIGLASLAEAVRALNIVDVERFYDTDAYHCKRRVLSPNK